MVVEPALFIALFPGAAVTLWRLVDAAHGLERRAAVRRVFLVRNDLGLVVQLEAGRAEVVDELVSNELRGHPRLGALRAGLHEGDTMPAVHDVQRLAHERTHALPPVDLEAAQVDALVLDLARGQLGDLAHALPASVVDVPRALGLMRDTLVIAGIDRLAARHLQLVLEVPLHDVQLRHAKHVAVDVVPVPGHAVRLGCSTNRRTGQAVARDAWFQLTVFLVVMCAGPAGMNGVGSTMDHPPQVANDVVDVALEIASDRVAIARREHDP